MKNNNKIDDYIEFDDVNKTINGKITVNRKVGAGAKLKATIELEGMTPFDISRINENISTMSTDIIHNIVDSFCYWQTEN